MKCPGCQQRKLQRTQLEKGLRAQQCEQCGGIWIPFQEYLTWVSKQEATSPEETTGETPLAVEEPDQAKICPDCGRILTRYRFWPDIAFHLDRCAHCSGVWCDPQEWAILKTHNLHARVHEFFTAPWQDRLRKEESRRRMERIYLSRFGAEDYSRLKEIRSWIEQHPQGAALLAYLNDANPYKG